jgi:hypothetical protein
MDERGSTYDMRGSMVERRGSIMDARGYDAPVWAEYMLPRDVYDDCGSWSMYMSGKTPTPGGGRGGSVFWRLVWLGGDDCWCGTR